MPPTQGWPMPFSNSRSAALSPGRISTPFSKSIAATHPINDMIRTAGIRLRFIPTILLLHCSPNERAEQSCSGRSMHLKYKILSDRIISDRSLRNLAMDAKRAVPLAAIGRRACHRHSAVGCRRGIPSGRAEMLAQRYLHHNF